MKIVVVGMPNEDVYEFSSGQQMVDAAKGRGWTYQGQEDQKHLLAHLQGMPKFAELAGPMGNGTDETGSPCVRYETWPANKFYSD